MLTGVSLVGKAPTIRIQALPVHRLVNVALQGSTRISTHNLLAKCVHQGNTRIRLVLTRASLVGKAPTIQTQARLEHGPVNLATQEPIRINTRKPLAKVAQPEVTKTKRVKVPASPAPLGSMVQK